MKTKAEKRIEAEIRQAEYDKLSTTEKLDLVKSRAKYNGGNAKREIERLTKLKRAEAKNVDKNRS